MKLNFKHSDIDWPLVIFIIIAILAVILIIGAIGYGIHNHNEQLLITDGYVTDKVYHAPWTGYHTTGTEKNKISVPVYHEAHYYIYVKSPDGKHTAQYEVTPTKYEQIKIGDYLSNVNRELK